MDEKAREYLELWRGAGEATEEIQLSKGPAVIRTSVSLLDLAAAGKIPVTLLTELEEIGKTAVEDPKKASRENFPLFVEAVNAVALAAFVAPPLSAAGDADHLPLDRVPFADRVTVFHRLNREVEPLRDFRTEQGRANGVARVGDGVPPAAVGDTADS